MGYYVFEVCAVLAVVGLQIWAAVIDPAREPWGLSR